MLLKRKVILGMQLSLILLVAKSVNGQFYNGSNLTFGKNRVQYHSFEWTFYKFDRFDTYFYLNGKELALYVSAITPGQIEELEKTLETTLEEKIQFIIFNTLSDVRQSNLGLLNDPYNTGGVTRIQDQKVILYFDGNHEHFKKQIREGVAQVLINQMLYGSSLGSQVKNSTLLFLPDWYTKGLISYLTEAWNTQIDNRVRDGILNGRYRKFNQLTGEDASYAGHSLWKYVADKYGREAVTNIVYMAKISKNVESGFLYVLGVSFKTIAKDWLSFYDAKYRNHPAQDSLPSSENRLLKPKKDVVYQKLRLSPDGRFAAFATNEAGLYKVQLFDLQKKKQIRILRWGYRLDEETDYSYPLLAWHPSGKLLSIITEEKGKTRLYFYTVGHKDTEKRFLFNFDKIIDFSYSPDGRSFVVSAVIKGQSDIFVYNIASNSYEQITKDLYDDFQPRFIQNGKTIVFCSNRTNDTLKPKSAGTNIPGFGNQQDLFLYDYANKSQVLRRITDSPLANEVQPIGLDPNHIAYLSDENGIYNRYVARFDSAITYVDTTTHYRYFTTSYPVTNYSRNIIDQDINPSNGQSADIIFFGNRYSLFINELESKGDYRALTLPPTDYMTQLIENAQKQETDSLMSKKKEYQSKRKRFVSVSQNEMDLSNDSLPGFPDNKIDINNYIFEKQAVVKLSQKDSAVRLTSMPGSGRDAGPRASGTPLQYNYLVEYSLNELVGQVDFNYLNYTYQAYTGQKNPIWLNPGFSVLLKVGGTDLMEDHRIIGGVRPSLNLTNNEYLVTYSNLKGRLDKEITFHRQILENDIEELQAMTRTYTHEFYYQVNYPFSPVMSIRGTALYRHDQISFLSLDEFSLREPDQNQDWASLKTEFVYDNTRSLGLNLLQGTRYKAFAEYFHRLSSENDNFAVIGLDFRHYLRIHRTFIWANRFAASTSFGTDRLVYFMGGVDNWLGPRFNHEVPVSDKQNYVYQTLATNLRGFTQNIRNGNSFALLNSELRFPVFRYFANRPIKSDFINNFQLMVFGDLGTAWNGASPYSKENSLYKKVIQQGPITVTIDNQVDPIVGGYGFGMRTRLLGYFLRADWAWGVEDMKVQDGVFYLSLSLDF